LEYDRREFPVLLDKQFVIDELKKQGESAKAQKALDELPAKIDHEQHAALLMKLGIDPGQEARDANGASSRGFQDPESGLFFDRWISLPPGPLRLLEGGLDGS
jgi:hypothetical protein